MAHEEIEMQLWEYIDGTCTIAEQERIAALLATDALWQEKHVQLMQLHTKINTGLELEQPSIRFSKNVMEALGQVNVAPATKQYINLYVIRAIAAFFVLGIASAFIYAISKANWAATDTSFVKLNFAALFSNSFFNMVIGVNIILGLLLLDILLRRKKTIHTS